MSKNLSSGTMRLLGLLAAAIILIVALVDWTIAKRTKAMELQRAKIETCRDELKQLTDDIQKITLKTDGKDTDLTESDLKRREEAIHAYEKAKMRLSKEQAVLQRQQANIYWNTKIINDNDRTR